MSRKQSHIDSIVNQAMKIELQEAEETGSLAFFARILVLATMPHSRPKDPVFKRVNGKFRLLMMADPDIGLPYGSIPRLTLSWLSTEAVRHKSRTLELGESLSDFMRQLDMNPTGGRWGSITRLREQMKRLFSTAISCSYEGTNGFAHRGFYIADEINYWWDPKFPEERTLWKSTVTLGEHFYKELIEHPVPLDMRALRALRKSPLALDIYTWLTYRMHFLSRSIVIPWKVLELQFGSAYSGTRQFRQKFLERLKTVMVVYPEARVAEEPGQGLKLLPSKPHVPYRGPSIGSR